MEKASHVAAEIIAQIALALVAGLFVSIVLAGVTMLLATSAHAAGELSFKTSAGHPVLIQTTAKLKRLITGRGSA